MLLCCLVFAEQKVECIHDGSQQSQRQLMMYVLLMADTLAYVNMWLMAINQGSSKTVAYLWCALGNALPLLPEQKKQNGQF